MSTSPYPVAALHLYSDGTSVGVELADGSLYVLDTAESTDAIPVEALVEDSENGTWTRVWPSERTL